MRKLTLISFTLMWLLSAQNSEIDKLVEGLLGDTPIEEDLQELCDVIGGRPTGAKDNFLSIDWGLEKFLGAGVSASKEEFIMSNLMWHKYGVLPTERKLTEENMWKLVDSMLTQENPSKIGAIKMYRRFIDSTLKEAKEMVDAREIKIKKEW